MNSVQLLGRLTKDPVNNNGVAMFTLAVDRYDKNGGADFPQIKVFGKQAENVCKYLHKGQECSVEGRIETGVYEKKDGEKVYYTDVIGNRIGFIWGGTKQAENGDKELEKEHKQEDSFEELDEDVPF